MLRMRTERAWFTLIEMVMVVGIVSLLAAMLVPTLAKVKYNARITQCQNNLKELGAALVLYQTFQGRECNAFPPRLTYLSDLQYVGDDRLYVCPMDSTKAIKHASWKQDTLKPGT